VKWLAYEMLPLKDDSNEANPENMGDLRESLRSVWRNKRFDILKKPYYSMTMTNKNLGGLGVDVNDCNKLLRDLERKSNWGPEKIKDRKSQDKYIINYFTPPVDQKLLSDYSIYVRKPMDISTIRSKLESPYGPPKYHCYHDFVEDLRLVFSNAIAYNRVHENTDTTGVSKKVLDAALHFQAKLDWLLNMDFSIDLCDKIMKDDIESTELRRKMVRGL
jgi:hypothetical protein